MADKNFKVKSGLQVPSLTTAGPMISDHSGNVTSHSTLSIEYGGTGQTTANNALNALLPLQTGNNNYFLQTNQVSAQWAKVFYQLIQNSGVSVTPRGILNIIGATFSDNAGTDTTTITFSGGSSTIVESPQTISSNYTLTTGSNGTSAGPVTIDSNVIVTIPNNAVWVVH